ncbi:hypothetical protein LTR10_012708 [Elasticomyces elasticus]|uniref:SMP-30/Gluconolactonase/LRE-like region domain-containing protein n=1 Tax=Exophiala sideris TaxID=1016849 RepID=A0ABR0JR79_9EURO|nr:hypothetical protein LTR10_012708 [Elasticomyces elasticus]KAK5034586.1 hypothetical protein LTR13_006241 [Exophiala sideris]KAK5040093.1 hypothetical protein LTS07_000590 [Exophiala sideris]KAK5068471.1 hypothetical protein LTR69_000591 [Exophiala sideris]KAK5187773.1 hypothetical protein LTR44_000591 [Eurotiomycetes sp. CCFEE 6388]
MHGFYHWPYRLLLVSLAFSNLATTNPTPRGLVAQVTPVYQFPNETWLENIAVRSNDHILTTCLTAPLLYTLDPATASANPIIVADFVGKTGVLGISEIEPDVFAVAAGNVSAPLGNGNYSIFKVDMRSYHAAGGIVTTPANVCRLVDIAEAAVLNGLALLNSQYLLIADGILGVVFRLDLHTAEYSVALNDTAMKPNASAIIQNGINGIHAKDGYLYYTSSGQYLFCRVPVHDNGTAAGPVEILNRNLLGDDFILDKQGNAFITNDPQNTLTLRTVDGSTSVITGSPNSTALAGDTACAWSRAPGSRRLYVSTNGGLIEPVNGVVVGGSIVAVDLSS